MKGENKSEIGWKEHRGIRSDGNEGNLKNKMLLKEGRKLYLNMWSEN